MSIFRCVDRRFETGEIFIKWDEASDEEWLLLIYIKNNSPDEGIIIEDKSNVEKNITHELKANEIFNASDLMVDSLTQLLARERSKKAILILKEYGISAKNITGGIDAWLKENYSEK